ncbi:MAG: hypothetical protein GF311_25305 [Candidatus Lokiarchaeota archaeon]|nr:hypothetical protein [Candidatus Lokiarchaeota archaeon]
MRNNEYLKVGSKMEHIYNGLNRQDLKLYSQVGGDPNPIHYDDDIAQREGLKGANAQYIYPTGFIFNLFKKFFNYSRSFRVLELGIYQQELIYSNKHLFYSSYWRCGDSLYSKATLSKIEGNNYYFDIIQTLFRPIKVTDNEGIIIKRFEALKKGYGDGKDFEKDLKTRMISGNRILHYNERILLTGYIIIKI